MTDHEHPIWHALDRLQMDLRAANSRLVELRAMVAALELPAGQRWSCPECGTRFASAWRTQEHRYNAHGGPLPDRDAAAERAAGLDA